MLDRLQAADLMLLWGDDVGTPADIGAIAILDRGPLVDPAGNLRIDEIRAGVGRRLGRVPRFRQILCRPGRGLGWPLWVDARDVDLAHHVGTCAVPAPGGEAELLTTCEQLRRKPFDTARPLWEMWLLSGLADGTVALFMKVHHTIADGVAGVATLAAFVDMTSDSTTEDAEPWRPGPIPTRRQLFADNVRRRAHEFAHAVSALARPIEALRTIRRALPALREIVGEGKAPRASFNRPIGASRRFAVVRGSLDTTKAIAHAHAATVNDVLLTAISGGLEDLLEERREHAAGDLRVFVPVSLHDPSAKAQGNLDGAMMVPLALGERDVVRRLELIAAETAERKTKSRPPAGALFRYVALQRAFLRFSRRQRMTNFYAANVPGPPVPIYFAGARVRELFPVVPLSGNLSIGVGALSYAGQFNITVVADRHLCPDLDTFVTGMRKTLDTLAETVRVPARRSA
jgi:diacylglycerol O-acyltransferase